MSPSSDVLIVDDDVDMAEVVREVLQSEGYSCRVAANGRHQLSTHEPVRVSA